MLSGTRCTTIAKRTAGVGRGSRSCTNPTTATPTVSPVTTLEWKRSRRRTAERDRRHGPRRARRRSRSGALGLPDPRRSRGVDPHREPAGSRVAAMAARRPQTGPHDGPSTTSGSAPSTLGQRWRRAATRPTTRSCSKSPTRSAPRTTGAGWSMVTGRRAGEPHRSQPDLALVGPELAASLSAASHPHRSRAPAACRRSRPARSLVPTCSSPLLRHRGAPRNSEACGVAEVMSSSQLRGCRESRSRS